MATATAVSSSQINLTWTASTDNAGVTGHQIFRNGTQVGTPSGTSYSDTGLTASTAYSYTVKARDAAGNVSASSNTASATTQAGASTKFSINDRVQVSSGPLNVRATADPAGTPLGTQATGNLGTMIGGPTADGGYNRWNINYDAGVDGWNAEDFLTKYTAPGTNYSIFTTKTPTLTNLSDGTSANYELGTLFQTITAGNITAIRFYKTRLETGTHTGHIWDASGNLLAIVTFAGETPSGWQVQNLTSPLAIAANTTYTVSVNTGATYYVTTNNAFTRAITNGPLSTVVGGNGTFGAAGAFPTQTYQASNYFRDVVFTATGTPPPTNITPPSTPTNLTASAVSSSQINLSWTASTDNVGVTGYKIFPAGTQVGTAATNSYSDTGLTASTAYSYTVSAYDAAGNNSAQSSSASATTQGGGTNGLLGTDPNFFPITVWAQTPETNATNYKNIGINLFSGNNYSPPAQTTLDALYNTSLGFLVKVSDRSGSLGLNHNSVIKSWYQTDEPDGLNTCTTAASMISSYNAVKAVDSTRPVLINFSPGAADVKWPGRGSCTGAAYRYADYIKGADILSFDIYPINQSYPITIIATGVDNLISWGGGKPVWAFIETTKFNSTNPAGPTPAQTKAEVWLALTHGAVGIQYFAHIFTPSFIEAGLLSDSAMKSAVSAIDAQITSLASVLNSPTVANGATVSSSVRIDKMVKQSGGFTYVFAVNPTATAANATFTVPSVTSGTVTVIDEGRTLTLSGNSFTDNFGAYGVHLYKITGGGSSDTTTPSTPTNLSASAVSSSQTNLSWTASTDNVGVTGYQVLRNGTQVGTPPTNSSSDTGLTASTAHSYTVKARDAAGNVSTNSNTASATTQAGGSSSCALPNYPTGSCTGVPAGTTLQTVNGDMTVTTAGQVIDGTLITGTLFVNANNVTVKNSEIDGYIINNASNFTIQDSTLGPPTGCAPSTYAEVQWKDYTALRVRVRGSSNAFKVGGSNVLIKDSYVVLCMTPTPGNHSDGIQVYGATNGTNITFDHNTIDQRPITNGTATSPIFIPNDSATQLNQNVHITAVTNNLLAGGGYSLWVRDTYAPWTADAVTGNKVVDGTWAYAPESVTCGNIQKWNNNAVVTYDWNTGTILSQVRLLTDCPDTY